MKKKNILWFVSFAVNFLKNLGRGMFSSIKKMKDSIPSIHKNLWLKKYPLTSTTSNLSGHKNDHVNIFKIMFLKSEQSSARILKD